MSRKACESWVTSCALRTEAGGPEIYAGHAAEIDCVLLDLILPEIKGRGAER